ncbi:MAG: mannonate dehydratase [Tepidisphaeraceae bacterium]
MKLGLGLYRQMLTDENFRFARQAGATHIVAHLTDYFRDSKIPASSSHGSGWGVSSPQPWTFKQFRDLKGAINRAGLELAALENLEPAHWSDILLDGPRRGPQIEGLKRMIRDAGRAGIPSIGYYFSIAGVWGHSLAPRARGDAESLCFDGGPEQTPIPNGMVWNMVYDPAAPAGHIVPVTSEQMWQRLSAFLRELVPVAEEAGVKLAAHPDDPPMPGFRGASRLIHQPDHYQRLLDLVPSASNCMEFCIGTLAEMSEGDIYEVVDHYSRTGRIAYIHFRNVRGKVPNYVETFLDEGDADMVRVMRILRRNGYDGVLIPDHTPRMTCDAPWHAGMAFALGFMRGILQTLAREQAGSARSDVL